MARIEGNSGNLADVNSAKQLLTRAVVESDLEYASEANGKAFSWSSSFATGGTGIEVLSIKNTSAADNLIIDEIVVAAAAACVFTLFEVTSGTAAGTTLTAKNLNLGLGTSAEATSFGNASVTGSLSGDTITYAACGASAQEVLDIKGALVLRQNDEIALTASANTTVYVTVIGHYLEKS